METEEYNLWNLILQTFVWGAMITTIILTHVQIRAVREGAKGQNILALVNFLQADNVRKARTLVREKLRNRPFADWTKEERECASLVCSTYDVASVLIYQAKLVPEGPFLNNWGPSIRDCFEILRPFISDMQKPERSGPGYWNDFAILHAAVVTRGQWG